MASQEFSEILADKWPELGAEATGRLKLFYEKVVEENQRQNLTRLIEPVAFWEGHIEDVRVLLGAQILDFPALDLGSGAGVPGLLAAAVTSEPWILTESEGRKAEFLRSAVDALGLKGQVEVFSGRAEALLREKKVGSVVARAVGPVERIYSWLRPCSTWNSLVLFKGPAWEAEWAEFEKGRYRGELRPTRTLSYEVGAEKKKRVLIRLERVPRGTPKKRPRTAVATP